MNDTGRDGTDIASTRPVGFASGKKLMHTWGSERTDCFILDARQRSTERDEAVQCRTVTLAHTVTLQVQADSLNWNVRKAKLQLDRTYATYKILRFSCP